MSSIAMIAVLICLAGITAVPKPNPEPEAKPNPKDIPIHLHGLGAAGSGGMAPVADGETEGDGGNRQGGWFPQQFPGGYRTPCFITDCPRPPKGGGYRTPCFITDCPRPPKGG